MAAFMVGKSLKDRRQNKAIEELFDKADKNGNGKISIQVLNFKHKAYNFVIILMQSRLFFQEYINIFSEHGINLESDEVGRISSVASDDGEVTREEFLAYAKSSEFFKSQARNESFQHVWSTIWAKFLGNDYLHFQSLTLSC